MAITKQQRRKNIHKRIRKQIKGNASRPRLTVFRSNKGIYCQAVDDTTGRTLAASDSLSIKASGTKIEQAKAVGQDIASKLKGINVELAYFDRSGYLFHGRVKALADGARESGIQL